MKSDRAGRARLAILMSACIIGEAFGGGRADPVKVDFDAYLNDPCHAGACADIRADPTAPGRLQGQAPGRSGPGSNVLVYVPSYVAPASCTSLLDTADNALKEVLRGSFIAGATGQLDVSYTVEGRLQYANSASGSPNPATGLAGIGAQLVLQRTDLVPAPAPQTLLFRWIYQTTFTGSEITQVASFSKQPAIATATVRRFIAGLVPGATYDLAVQHKWTRAFSAFQPATNSSSIVAGGLGRGALACEPTLILETW